MSIDAVARPTYATPHFIEALGEDGLTAHEIARGLCINVKHVHEKFKGNQEYLDVHGWRVVEISTTNETNGLRVESYALNTRAAKMFVATYQNSLGRKYLDFLFDCEEVVVKAAQQLKETMSRLDALERDNALLRQKALPREKLANVFTYENKNSLFDDGIPKPTRSLKEPDSIPFFERCSSLLQGYVMQSHGISKNTKIVYALMHLRTLSPVGRKKMLTPSMYSFIKKHKIDFCE